MDLTVLADSNLPKKVVLTIEEEFQFYSGVLEILDHEVRSLSKTSSSSLHYLYLCIREDDQRLSYLVNVDWIEYSNELSKFNEGVGTINVYKMHKSDFRIFKELLPELSEV